MRQRASFGPSNSQSRPRRTPSRDCLSGSAAGAPPRVAAEGWRETRANVGAWLLPVGLLLASAGCATWNPPPPQAAARAAAADVYSGSLRVSVKGEGVRGRTPVLVAFRRPASVRLEIPGSAGAQLVAVVRGDRLTAIFPARRAVFEGAATAAGFDALLGVALAPEEFMDILVGVAPARLRSYRAGWGERLPARIEAVLPDGTRLKAAIADAVLGPPLSAAVFEVPPHRGYRPVDAAEARRFLGGR